jgi:hypothetical protein
VVITRAPGGITGGAPGSDPEAPWKVRQIPCFPSRLMELQNASRPLLSPAKPAHAHICQASEPARKWRGVSTTSAPAIRTVQIRLRRFVIDAITFNRMLSIWGSVGLSLKPSSYRMSKRSKGNQTTTRIKPNRVRVISSRNVTTIRG